MLTELQKSLASRSLEAPGCKWRSGNERSKRARVVGATYPRLLICAVRNADRGVRHATRPQQRIVKGVGTVSKIKRLSKFRENQYEFLWPPEECIEWHIDAERHEPHQLLEKADVACMVHGMVHLTALGEERHGAKLGVVLPHLQDSSFWTKERRSFVTHSNAAAQAKVSSLVEAPDDDGTDDDKAPGLVDDEDHDPGDSEDDDDDAHDYTICQIVAACIIAHELKDQAKFADIVQHVMTFCGLAPFTGKCPHRSNLQRWSVKMDAMLMLYRQEQWKRGFYKDVSFQVGADSSPQIGEDYFVVREELVRVVPHKGWQHNPLSCLRIASRTKPLTSTGWGETGLAKKHTRMSHCVWLDAGEQHHADYRRQTKQCFADQGTEKALWSCPNILGLDTTEDIITRLNNGEMQLHGIEA